MAAKVQQLRDQMQTATELKSVVDTMRALAEVNVRRSQGVARDFAQYARSVHLAGHVVLRALARERRRQRRPLPTGRGPLPVPAVVEGGPDVASGASGAGELVAVVITSDQGLCGAFNDRITAYALARVREWAPGKAGRKFIAVGYRGFDKLRAEGEPIAAYCDGAGSIEAIPSVVSQLLIALEDRLRRSRLGRVVVFANRPQPGGGFQEGHIQLVPLETRRWQELPGGEPPFRTVPQHDLAPYDLLRHLVREQLYVDLFQALVDSFTAENGARLSAMRTAAENIQERLEALEAEYRRQRQAQVTQELMDVMGGVEAVASTRRPLGRTPLHG